MCMIENKTLRKGRIKLFYSIKHMDQKSKATCTVNGERAEASATSRRNGAVLTVPTAAAFPRCFSRHSGKEKERENNNSNRREEICPSLQIYDGLHGTPRD